MRIAIAVGTLLLSLSAVVQASEYNFFEQNQKKGCQSVITERGQDECSRTQQAKDDACRPSADCDASKHEKLIAEYKEAKEQLDRGQLNDADKGKTTEKVARLKDLLDRGKSAARDGLSVVQGCVTARENVQKWFAETGIPLTERTRDEAMRQRKDLLERLSDAQRKHADAKNKRDAKPGDSSAQTDLDRGLDAVRDVERALEQFNKRYGNDIERYADRLIAQYKEERELHEKPLADARNRRDKCVKIDNMSY